jgi:hypothetical protein
LLLVAVDYFQDRGIEILRIREKLFATEAKAAVREAGNKQQRRYCDGTGRKQPFGPSRRQQHPRLVFPDLGVQSLRAEAFVSLLF